MNKNLIGIVLFCVFGALITTIVSNQSTPTVTIGHVDLSYPKTLSSKEKSVSPEAMLDIINKDISDKDIKSLINTLPSSLSDASPPSKLDVDAEGNLIINMKIKHLFEFYLTAIGEENLDIIILRIKESLKSQLKDQSLITANEILEGYLQYRNNIANIKNQYTESHDSEEFSMTLIKNMKDEIIQSRSAFLSQEVSEVFFTHEDEYDIYMMSRIEIGGNSNYSAEYKLELIQDLEDQAPSWITSASKRSNIVAINRLNELNLIKEGASESDIYDYRVSTFGQEIADKKNELDIKRNNWKNKINLHKKSVQRIMESDQYTESEKSTLINNLRDDNFQGSEKRRAIALDGYSF